MSYNYPIELFNDLKIFDQLVILEAARYGLRRESNSGVLDLDIFDDELERLINLLNEFLENEE